MNGAKEKQSIKVSKLPNQPYVPILNTWGGTCSLPSYYKQVCYMMDICPWAAYLFQSSCVNEQKPTKRTITCIAINNWQEDDTNNTDKISKQNSLETGSTNKELSWLQAQTRDSRTENRWGLNEDRWTVDWLEAVALVTGIELIANHRLTPECSHESDGRNRRKTTHGTQPYGHRQKYINMWP